MNIINNYDPLIKSKFWLRIFLIALLLFVTIFLRIYKISSVPSSFNQDEAAIGYNAYSILETGKDEWGASYPLYFKSFGDQKLPAYIYTTALFVKAVGLNEYAVRLPSAFAGIVSVFVLLYLVYYLTKNFTLGFLAALLLSLTPWHLQYSRAGFEVNFSLASALIGATLFVLAVDKKKFIVLILSLLFFSISLYSYNVSRLLSPLLLAVLSLQYLKKIREFKTIQLCIAFVFFALTLLPFFISFFSNAGIFSATSSLITSSDITAKSVEMRSYLISLPSWYSKIFYNKYIFIIFQYIQNLALVLSGSFFFVSGSPYLVNGIGNVGTFYLFQLPLFVVGLIHFFSKRIEKIKLFILWLLISVFTLALSKEVPNATRSYFLVIPVAVFSALGFLVFMHYIANIKNIIYKSLLVISVLFFVIYNLQFYFASYYFRYPIIFTNGDKMLANYLEKVDYRYNKVIIDDKSNFAYISFLFYNKYPPEKFIKTVKRYDDRVLLTAKSWGKYEIRGINWDKDTKDPNVLLISDEKNPPKNMPILHYLYFPTKKIVLSVNDKIVQYPMTDIAWYIVDSNAVLRETQTHK